MKPIGLTLKRVTTNPFTSQTSGELMIVHQCLGCGVISCNRIAGDDNSYSIMQLIEEELNVNYCVFNDLKAMNIQMLTLEDKVMALCAIYGYGYEKYVK